MSKPYIEIVTSRMGPHVLASTCREATQAEIDEAMHRASYGKCLHEVVVDTPGYLYDFRDCYCCGAGLGTV